MSARIEARGLGVRFRRGDHVLTVFSDLNIVVEPGEMVAVSGPSLSGKTTLVEVLAGWRAPDAGSVAWNGERPSWSSLTVVPQAFALLEELSVVENILLSRRVAGHSPVNGDDRLEDLLTRLGLTRLRDRGGFEISVGERQRTMVARALVDRPAVVLADEPAAHQDDHHARVVLDLLRQAATGGAACLVATRQPDIAALADRVVDLGS